MTVTTPSLLQVDKPVETILNDFLQRLERLREFSAGYPENLDWDYTPLLPFLRHFIVNSGDPFIQDKFVTDNSKNFERQSLHWFAQLYELQDYWGYVTSGGTEGNIYGIFLGRELYPDGVVYFSKDSHFSIPKAVRLLRIPHVIVNSQPNGEIDYEHLEQELSQHKHRSAILNLNLGTTMKGAVDRIERVVDILEGFNIPFHIHCDGALGGMLLPFIDGSPKISFKDYPIGSIAVSGHKFIGSPIPYGIVLTRKEFVNGIGKYIECIGTEDTTIMGSSRCGLTPLFLWYTITTRSQNFAREVSTCLHNARYLRDRLTQIGRNPLLNEFSTTVVFEKPSIEVCSKWHLATEESLAHIVVMQHISIQKIEQFINDIEIEDGDANDVCKPVRDDRFDL